MIRETIRFGLTVLAVIVGLTIYNNTERAYADYKHKAAIAQCESDVSSAPQWTYGITHWACERWVK